MRRPVPFLLSAVLAGCTRLLPVPQADAPEDGFPQTVAFSSGAYATRSADPDEGRISDINLFVFRERTLVERKYFRLLQGSPARCTLRLLKDVPYSFYACANVGYALDTIRTLDQLLGYRYHMVYPDEYREGMPMAGRADHTFTGEEDTFTISLERLLARLTLSIDRTALDPGVRFSIRSIEVGGCPNSALLFSPSRAESARHIFAKGFTKSGAQVDPLNSSDADGQSGTVGLYLMENRQGDLLEGTVTDRGKVFPDGDPHAATCSYVEIRADYYSDRYYSGRDQYLIYRFYLGDGRDNFDVERNCDYRITVRPEGSGINEESWRVDKSRLGVLHGTGTWDLVPSHYNTCMPGDTCHLRCETVPASTEVTFDREWLDEAVERRILSGYALDPDGHGIRLYALERGSAVFRMAAGPPVDRDTVALLVVDPTVIVNPSE